MHLEPITRANFLARVLVDDGCWLWLGGQDGSGYGAMNVGTRGKKAHRISYEIFYGGLDDSACVCHHCDNPLCVKPSHLFVGTRADNNHDRDAKGRQMRGSRHVCAKLTEADVLAIRRRIAGGERQADLAREYGVSKYSVNGIHKRRKWTHI